MLSLSLVIIGVTFFLGVGLVVFAGVALLRGVRGKGGSVELLGVKVSGASAPALFLVVGAAMMLSCFGWATAEREVAEKTQEVTQKTAEIQEKSRELARVTEQSTHMARDLARVKVAYEEQRALSADLVARMPSALERLPAEQRARLEAPAVELSPSTLDALRRLRP